MCKKIWASIVTYNPEKNRLRANLESVRSQVDSLVIVDNGSQNVDDVRDLASQFDCHLILNRKNEGIAFALNQCVDYVTEHGDVWLLTLDQDSVCKEGLIDCYKKYLNAENVGMLSCGIYDRNTGIVSNGIIERHLKFKSYKERELQFVPVAITSGCLMNACVAKNIGGFDNQMFIDYVDFDYCLSLHESGYRILKVDFVGLLHEIGHAKKIKILGRDCILTNHSPIRHYYISRNTVYFIRKYNRYVNKISITTELLARVFIVPFFEKNSFAKLKAALKGLLDGIRMKLR
ncbi:MAG: glycosyltransferase family 2 protein [Fibrobacter sp.]|nr:glycosyltransferase family 2 protein [Fibrobacter sp.]